MKVWNTKLLPLKGLLFVFFGAFGCLWPFFTVHMKQLGLSIRETAIINLLLPFLSAFVAPILSTLIDRFGNYRRFLVIACTLMGLLYSALLFVPPVTEDVIKMREPELLLLCSKTGSTISICKHSERCERLNGDDPLEHTLRLNANNCSLLCSPDAFTTINSVNFEPMCLVNFRDTICHPLFNETELLVSAQLNFDNVTEESVVDTTLVSRSSQCFHSVNWILHENITYKGISCPRLNSKCTRVCQLIEMGEARLTRSSHFVTRRSMLTFWVYIVTRAFADVLFCLSFPLTDAISITLLRIHGGSFGRQMLFGILALGVAGPIAGVFIDVYSNFLGRQDYMPCFAMFDLCMVLTIAFVCCMPFTVSPQPKGVYRALLRLLKDIEVLALYIAVTTLGTNFGFLEAFLYWFLEDLGASQFLIGITWTVGVFPSLPFLWKSKVILEKVGHANLLAFAFFVYAIRYLGYSFIDDPWLCLPFESIEVFTFFLTRATYCTYSALLTPPALMVTSQTMMVSLHLMIGKGLGSLVGGYVMASYGPRRTFRAAAGFCCICGISYFLLYQLHIKAKAKKKLEKSIAETMREVELNANEVNDALDDVPMDEINPTENAETKNHTKSDGEVISTPFLKPNGTDSPHTDEDSIGYNVALANPYS